MKPRAEPEVVLRAVDRADLSLLFAHQCDSIAYRMAGFVPRDEPAFFAHWGKILEDPQVVSRTVLADGAVAGHLVCWRNEGLWEVGYWIDRALWGRGIAGAGLRQFLKIVRRRPLHAQVSTSNLGSIRVLEKCGFQPQSEQGATGSETDRRFVLNS